MELKNATQNFVKQTQVSIAIMTKQKKDQLNEIK